MGDVDRVNSPPAVYTGVMIEHWDYTGRGPRKGWVAFQARNKDGDPYWKKALVALWDRDLPPVGEQVEMVAEFQAYVYNGNLRGEMVAKQMRTGSVHPDWASVPVPAAGRTVGGDTRAAPQQRAGGWGPTEGQAREQQAPPPDDDWNF